jgi:ADP-ribose pyrophosphatase YjhB (NUDIX family)
MKLLAEINLENVAEGDAAVFKVRNTARAVIFDSHGNVALMSVSKEYYHKLPGGGIEKGEKVEEALRRECKEEAGVEIGELVELGSIREIKNEERMIQNSYCYSARVIGDKGPPQFTEAEKERGFEVMWININDAIALIESESYKNSFGKIIAERELSILRAAR